MSGCAFQHCYFGHFIDNLILVPYNVGTPMINTSICSYLSDITIQLEVSDNEYEWKIMKNSKGEIKQYCEADLIA